jgi:signal transduction histidine kinase
MPGGTHAGERMGDHFSVEVQDLVRLLKQLHDSQDDMRKALGALKEVGPKSTGSEALDNACDEFHDSWDNAIKKIADGTEQIEEKLRATKDNYEATEQVIRDAMSTKGAAQSSPQTAPRAVLR